MLYEHTVECCIRPLHLSARNGHLKVARALIEAGADVNAKEDDRCTPLHLSARDGHLKVARTLIEAGADVNAKDKGGCTPLQGSMTIVRILLDAGAEYSLLECCVDCGLKSSSALGALTSKYPRLVALSLFLFVNGALVFLSLVAGLFNIMVCVFFAIASFVLVLQVLIFTTCPPDNNSRDNNNAMLVNVGNY